MTAVGRPRLRPDTLRRAGGTARPALGDRPSVGIVHLGIGAFHRAHQAAYTAEALEHEPGDWGICGVAQRRRNAVDALAPQEGLFSLLERGHQDRLTVLSPVREVLLAPAEPERLTEALASPGVHIVTLTVTEAGYAADAPVVGQILRGLQLRAGHGEAGPLTVISCDNLPRNGEVLGGLVREAAGDGSAREWIERHVRFPCTMVDRVVPATTPNDYEVVARRLGLEDRAAVVAEPFRQWVIEDAFAGPRPAWERAGALLVADSGPHEAVKLRLLNGTHSLLAYLGGLVGAKTVAGAWGDPDVAAAADRLAVADLEPTLPAAPGIDIAEYRAELGRRWNNPRIGHRLEQIAMDGSKKLPARFRAPALERLAAGAPPRWIALIIAAWARHLLEAEGGLAVRDVGAEPIRAALGAADGPGARAAAVLDPAVWGEELSASAPLRELVTEWLERFEADGAVRAVRAAVQAR